MSVFFVYAVLFHGHDIVLLIITINTSVCPFNERNFILRVDV